MGVRNTLTLITSKSVFVEKKEKKKKKNEKNFE